MTNYNMPSRPQQPARRPQRLVLIVHVYKASSEDDRIGRPFGCWEIDDVATPSPHLRCSGRTGDARTLLCIHTVPQNVPPSPLPTHASKHAWHLSAHWGYHMNHYLGVHMQHFDSSGMVYNYAAC